MFSYAVDVRASILYPEYQKYFYTLNLLLQEGMTMTVMTLNRRITFALVLIALLLAMTIALLPVQGSSTFNNAPLDFTGNHLNISTVDFAT